MFIEASLLRLGHETFVNHLRQNKVKQDFFPQKSGVRIFLQKKFPVQQSLIISSENAAAIYNDHLLPCKKNKMDRFSHNKKYLIYQKDGSFQ